MDSKRNETFGRVIFGTEAIQQTWSRLPGHARGEPVWKRGEEVRTEPDVWGFRMQKVVPASPAAP